jgi:hypothetical protein
MMMKPEAQGLFESEPIRSQTVDLTWEGLTEPVDSGLKNWEGES